MNHRIFSFEPSDLLLWTTTSFPMNHQISSYEQHISIYEPPHLLLWAISSYEPPHIRLLISLSPISNFLKNHKSESESEMSTWKPQPGISEFLI